VRRNQNGLKSTFFKASGREENGKLNGKFRDLSSKVSEGEGGVDWEGFLPVHKYKFNRLIP